MKGYFSILRQTISEFNSDKVPRLGAALAYYTIFSIAPLLLIAIAIAGFVFGQDAARQQVFDSLRGVLGPNSANAIKEMVQNAAKPKAGTIATIAGVVTLFLGASGVFGQLKDALNTIWDVKPKPSSGILSVLKDRFLSLAMVLGVGFLLLVSLVIDAVIAGMGHFASSHLPGGEALWQVVQQVFSVVIVALLFALIFRYLPDLHIAWHDVTLGAIVTSVLFVIGKFALGLYLGKSAVGSSYGAAGSLVVVLLWVYYSSQIVLFGAEFTQVYARERGSLRKVEREPAKLDGHVPADAAGPQGQPVPAVIYRTQPAHGGGAGKLAVGGLAGMLVGALVGGFGAAVVLVKSVKKLIL